MENKPNIGKILTAEENARDAIHCAIIPVIAAHKMSPAAHVGLDKDGKASYVSDGEFVGIVDPFLEVAVAKGQRFYLFLYPNTITSLKHVWQHPAFDEQISAPKELTPAQLSEKWIRDYAETDCDGLSYEDLMYAAESCAKHGDYLTQGGRFEGMGVSDEFWNHYEIVTGQKVEEKDRGCVFSCSC